MINFNPHNEFYIIVPENDVSLLVTLVWNWAPPAGLEER